MVRFILGLVFALCFNIAAFAETEASFPLKYERLQESTDEKSGVKVIETVTGHGTAFAISTDTLLTCAHNIIDDEKKIPYDVMWVEVYGKKFVIRPLYYNRNLDLAVVATLKPMNLKETLGLATNNAFLGDSITIAGSLRGTPVEDYKGKVTGIYHEGTIRTCAAVQFDHGLSGSPVLNDTNQVVGIATAGIPKDGDLDKTQGLFVPASIVREFMREYFLQEDKKFMGRKIVVLKNYTEDPKRESNEGDK